MWTLRASVPYPETSVADVNVSWRVNTGFVALRLLLRYYRMFASFLREKIKNISKKYDPIAYTKVMNLCHIQYDTII